MAIICFLLLLFILDVEGTCFNPNHTRLEPCTWCWSYFENSRGPHTVEDIEYGGCDGKDSGYSPCTKELGFNLPIVKNEEGVEEGVSYLECKRTTRLPAYHDALGDMLVSWNGKVCCCALDMCNKDVERLDKSPLPIQCQNWPNTDDQHKYSNCENDTCFGYFVKESNKWEVYRSGCSLGDGDLEGVCRSENIEDGRCAILDASTYKHYTAIDEKMENKTMKVCCCKGDKCNEDQLIDGIPQFPTQLNCYRHNEEGVCSATNLCYVYYNPDQSYCHSASSFGEHEHHKQHQHHQLKHIIFAGCDDHKSDDPCTKFNIKAGQCKTEEYKNKKGKICCCDNFNECNGHLDLFEKSWAGKRQCFDNGMIVSKCKEQKTEMCFHDCHTTTSTVQRGCSEGKEDFCQQNGIKDGECKGKICCCAKDNCNSKDICDKMGKEEKNRSTSTSTKGVERTKTSQSPHDPNGAKSLMSNVIGPLMMMIIWKLII